MQGGGADASEAGEDVVIELGGMMGGQTMLEEQYSESRALSVQDIERSVRYNPIPIRTPGNSDYGFWWVRHLTKVQRDPNQGLAETAKAAVAQHDLLPCRAQLMGMPPGHHSIQVTELAGVFQKLGEMVSLQAEQIERIDANMDETLHHVDQGHSQLVKVSILLSSPFDPFSYQELISLHMLLPPTSTLAPCSLNCLVPRVTDQQCSLVLCPTPLLPSLGSTTTP